MTRIIRATLAGPEARLGSVPAADVARLIIGLERALARAAYVALGKSREAQSGRHTAAIERATRLRFVGIEPGSVVELLALPDVNGTSDALELPVDDLSAAAFEQLVGAIRSQGEDVDPELAASVAQLSDELGIGDRHEHLSLGHASTDIKEQALGPALIDLSVRRRMRAIAQRPRPTQNDTLVGVLVEADFERRTARLQPPVGRAVTVTFAEDLADALYEALRQPAHLKGTVRYDAKTAAARAIELRQVTRAEQLVLEGEVFFKQQNVYELAAEQGVPGPVRDSRELSDPGLSSEEREALLTPLIEA